MTAFRALLFFFLSLNPLLQPASAALLPEDQSQNVSLYPLIQWIDCTDAEASCQLTDTNGQSISGIYEIKDNTLTFYPCQLLEPSETYHFQVTISNNTWSTDFTTTSHSMPDRWVEVILGDVQKVLVWEDQQVTHAFPCSGGTEETPSILGMYSMVNRGENFYSERVGEGAFYWIRIQGNYLFHGIVRDADGNPLPGEADKIGTAASHGCIRLYDEDALWLYENMPDGTTVVIHPGLIIPVTTK